MSQERYPVLWIGQVAVVTLPAEIDVTNAEMVREELLARPEPGRGFADRGHEQNELLRFRRSKRPGARIQASQHAARVPCDWSSARRPYSACSRLPGSIAWWTYIPASPRHWRAPGDQSGQWPGQPDNATAKADTDGGALGPPFLERRRRLRGFAGDAGHDRAGDIPEFHIAILRGGPQDGECTSLSAMLPGHDYPERLVNYRPRSQRRTQLLDKGRRERLALWPASARPRHFPRNSRRAVPRPPRTPTPRARTG